MTPTPGAETEAARRALLDAAERVLTEQGPDALTVRNVAAAAGCSTMVVYSRFGSKEGLVDELVAEGFRRLTETIAAVRRQRDTLANLRACSLAYRRFALENPEFYTVMFERAIPGHEPSDDTKRVALDSFEVLVARVRRAIDAGVMRGCPRSIAHMLWAANHGLVSLELHGVQLDDVDWERLHRATLDRLVTGIATSPPAEPIA